MTGSELQIYDVRATALPIEPHPLPQLNVAYQCAHLKHFSWGRTKWTKVEKNWLKAKWMQIEEAINNFFGRKILFWCLSILSGPRLPASEYKKLSTACPPAFTLHFARPRCTSIDN